MSREMPVIKVYERPFEKAVSLNVGTITATLHGETFATHESLMAAIYHESVPSKPPAYVKEVVASMGVSTQEVEISDLSKRVFQHIVQNIAELAADGVKVVNLTRLSLIFAIKTAEHPEVSTLDPVSRERVLIGVMSLLAFIRDECTFEIATRQGSVMDYVQ